jgi:acyl-[acyl-carrier-protein]-phospholipid O-acyltransferase/long-chain-fatty-acid--[acyl-carrier-protein] ligase
MGLMAVPIFIYATYRLPHAMVRIFLWWAVKIFYRIRVVGIDHIPKNGGAILVSNHVSTFDGILFLLMTSRTTRMLAWAGNFANPVTRFLAKFSRTILMTGGPKSIQRGLADARKALARGELVGMFPEGGLSRTGGIQSFKPGLMKVLDKMPVPIVPVYIDEMWGSNLTWANQGSIFRIPKRFRQPITVNIGPPFTRSDSIHEIRQAVQKLGAEAVQNRQSTFLCPAQKFIRSAKKRKFKFKLGCSTGQEATGGALLMRVLILRRLLNRHVLPDRNVEKNIGVLLPPSFGAVAVNLALGLDRRVAVNLNYTVSSDILNICIKQAKIKRVLTSKKVWEKFDYQLDAEIVFVEELKDKVTTGDKLAGLIGSYVTPAILLERQLHLHECKENDVLTIIFTSGSTGIPKGVLLTHGNVASNVEAIDEVINLDPRDTMIGILPLFHSMGYTVTMWAPMGLNVAGAYHFNPLDARQIGKLTQKYGGTVLLGTPTFLRSYVRRISPEEFSTLDTVVAGAEHLPKDLCDAFERKFGVRPVEGYGTTELSPLVSVNVPPSRSRKNFQIDCKEGTVGRPIPNVAAKITDLDDDSKELDKGEPGMLWITGPNVMAGYLNNPEATAAVLINGWYNTGDVALIDKDGFIQITGRISRFSKIGGEMVPHVQIEETLNEIVGEDVDDDGEIDEMKIAVSAVPHPKKGERIVVLHTKIKQDIHDLCKQLSVRGLPNIYIPSADSFVEVEALPMLGSGKLDLKKLKMMAEELFAGSNSTK